MPDFKDRFDSGLKNFKLKNPVAVACSGGVDSLALAVLLSRTHKVIALIIDHGLRKESASEAAKTAKLLDKLGIENAILKKKHKISSNIQEEARKLRYELLLSYCKKHKIKHLATAHHADDNAETFLLRLSRGSGVDGLSGIAETSVVEGVNIIRPLLKFQKSDLAAFLKAQKIRAIEDPTNRTDKYKRNSLRHALEKLEDSELITSRINDAAENLARVRNFLEQETEKSFKKYVNIQNDKAILDVKTLARLHEEISYRLLVKLVMQMGNGEKKPRFEKLKRLKNDLLNYKPRTLGGLVFKPGKGKMAEKIIITIEKPGN